MRHYTIPLRKIVVDPTSAADEVQKQLIRCDVFRSENAVDRAQLLFSDDGYTLYDNTIVHGDDLAIYLNWKAEEDPLTSSSLRFYGYVEDMIPNYDANLGATLLVSCRHYSRCLTDMLCGQEYGTESNNPTLDTPKEIITDSTDGVVSAWVNKVLGTATASGYSLDTTVIEDVVSGTAIKYLYYPYKPAINCLDDLQDHSQAVQGTSAGFHWIVKTEETAGPTFTNYLLAAIVGTHPSSPVNVAAKWPTWWNTDQSGSTIVVNEDMVTSQFTTQRPEANYILYHGRFIKPGDTDVWTENNASEWGYTGFTAAPTDESTIVKVGGYSIKELHTGGSNFMMYYPSAADLSLDIEKMGGEYNPAEIKFHLYLDKPAGNTFTQARIHMQNDTTAGSNSYYYDLLSDVTMGQWADFTLPVGDYTPSAYPTFDGWVASGGTEDWGDVDAITFEFDFTYVSGLPGEIYIDGLHFLGHVIRGAYKSSPGKYKIKKVFDDIAKEDSLVASDDSYPIARFAYAELLRASTTPTTGKFVIPAQPSILAGQKCHVHACHVSGSTYRVNRDMRILEHQLSFGPDGFLSYVTVTDDVKNSLPMQTYDQYNILQRMTRPEDDDRHRSSLVSRAIDITQPILEKAYTLSANWWRA